MKRNNELESSLEKEASLKKCLEMECQKLNTRIRQTTLDHEEVMQIKQSQLDMQDNEVKTYQEQHYEN